MSLIIGDGSGGSGAGAWIVGVKVTNDQPMVFTSEANRDTYFSNNPDELTRVSGSTNIVGIGTIVEDTSSVPSDGWWAYGYQGVAGWRQTVEIAVGARGPQGDPGSTPSVIVEQVAAPSHGLTPANVLSGLGVRRDETDPRNWVAASSNDINTCASSMLADIVDANNILVILEGVANQPSHGFTIGGIYYLGANGFVTDTIPITGRVQQIFTVIDANNVLINIGQSHQVEMPARDLNGTGVFRGGVPSLQSSSVIRITAGSGDIFSLLGDINTSVTVEWAQTDYNPPLGVDGDFVITIDVNGDPMEVPIASYTTSTRRDVLILGVYTIAAGAITSVTPFVISANEPAHQMFDFMECFGATVKNGLNITADGANLEIDLSGGELHFIGAGSQQGNRQQNILNIAGVDSVVFSTLLGRTGVVGGTTTNTIDPTVFDNGTGAPVNVGGSPNSTTVARAYILPSSPAVVFVAYGQQVYSDLDEAISRDSESDFQLPDFMNSAVLRARIAVTRTATSLEDEVTSRIMKGSKFGAEPLSSSGGGGSGGTELPPEFTTSGLTPNGARFVIATVDPVASGAAPQPFTVDFDFRATNASGTGVVNSRTVIRGIAGGNVDDNPSFKVYRDSQYPLDETDVTYGIYRASNDIDDGYIITVDLAFTQAYDVTIRSNRLGVLDPNVTFSSQLTPHTIGSEVPIKEIDLNQWQTRNVGAGFAGGLAVESVGDYEGETGAHTKYVNGEVVHFAGGADIQRLSSTGSRFSSGMFSSSEGWPVFPTTGFPIDAVFFETLIAQKRATKADTTLNSLSTITLTAVDGGSVVAENMVVNGAPFDGHRGLRFNATGSGGLDITFADCFHQRVQFNMTFGSATSSSTTQDYEIVDSDGNQLLSFDIPDTNNDPGSVNSFTFEFSGQVGDYQVTLRKRSSGTGQTVYMYDYDMNVFVDEPAQIERVGVQFDDPTDGTMLQRVLVDANNPLPQGTLALNSQADNRLVWSDGEAAAYVNTTRIDFADAVGQFFFAEGNTLAEAGWTGSNINRWVNTLNFRGFPEVIRITQTGGTVTAGSPNNTQAFWDTCRANGFRTDLRIMCGATHDGSLYLGLEPNNTSWGSNGRYESFVNVSAGQLQLTMVNSGGNTSVNLDRDVMHTITYDIPAGSNVANVLLEDEKVGEIDYTGSGTTDRGTFFYIPPGNPVNDMSILSVTTYTLDDNAIDAELGRRAIETGLRYNVPNVNVVGVTRRVPKGLYDFGNTFTIVNGSTESCAVTALVDDHQLFGGSGEYEVLPQREVNFTQTAFPRGNVWAVDDSPLEGNSVYLTIESDGSILYRDPAGTYKGTLNDLGNPQTGQYSFGSGVANFAFTTSWANATAISNTGAKMTATCTIASDLVFIDVTDAGGNRVNDRFFLEVRWS